MFSSKRIAIELVWSMTFVSIGSLAWLRVNILWIQTVFFVYASSAQLANSKTNSSQQIIIILQSMSFTFIQYSWQQSMFYHTHTHTHAHTHTIIYMYIHVLQSHITYKIQHNTSQLYSQLVRQNTQSCVSYTYCLLCKVAYAI